MQSGEGRFVGSPSPKYLPVSLGAYSLETKRESALHHQQPGNHQPGEHGDDEVVGGAAHLPAKRAISVTMPNNTPQKPKTTATMKLFEVC